MSASELHALWHVAASCLNRRQGKPAFMLQIRMIEALPCEGTRAWQLVLPAAVMLLSQWHSRQAWRLCPPSSAKMQHRARRRFQRPETLQIRYWLPWVTCLLPTYTEISRITGAIFAAGTTAPCTASNVL